MCILIPKYYFITSYRIQYKKKKEEEPTIQKKSDKVYKSPNFIRDKDNELRLFKRS